MPHEVDPVVLEPFKYISETPGKDVRGALIDAFQTWLKIPQATIPKVKSIVSALHNASLLVDDIEDGSQLRRGKPVAHLIFGVPMTLNCANYAYFIALEQCQNLENPEAMQVFVEELLNLHRGQGQDILWRDTNSCPSVEKYEKMVLDKTGGLFRLAVGLMAAFSEESAETYRPLVNALALYFQIRDDYVNLRSDEYMHSKSYCEDITEGKFSYPIIHAILSNPNDTRLLSILKQRTSLVDVKRHAVDFMDQLGAFTATRDKLHHIRENIHTEIDRLGGHPILTALIDRLDHQVFGDESSSSKEEEEEDDGQKTSGGDPESSSSSVVVVDGNNPNPEPPLPVPSLRRNRSSDGKNVDPL